mmetsp:Transcript_26515/g.55478  ORF Transcript_26515/g.55478 Transcript_26515/m.55478 type:complete len:208 (-) Transcript_26515:441-1064(-)
MHWLLILGDSKHFRQKHFIDCRFKQILFLFQLFLQIRIDRDFNLMNFGIREYLVGGLIITRVACIVSRFGIHFELGKVQVGRVLNGIRITISANLSSYIIHTTRQEILFGLWHDARRRRSVGVVLWRRLRLGLRHCSLLLLLHHFSKQSRLLFHRKIVHVHGSRSCWRSRCRILWLGRCGGPSLCLGLCPFHHFTKHGSPLRRLFFF